MKDFTAAKNYLLEHGWIKGTMYALDGSDSVCVVGACAKVGLCTEDAKTDQDVWIVLGAIAREQFPDRLCPERHSDIVAVNDHPDTTLADIVMILEKAAANQ